MRGSLKIIYFDLCAIPVYLLILWTCYVRGFTKGRANQIFILVNVMSLTCAFLDILMEFVVNPVPLSHGSVLLGTAISFTYKLLRNTCVVIYLVYIFVMTKTSYILRPLKSKLFLGVPLAILVILLFQNFFTHNVFQVTAAEGYSRGPLLIVLYLIALLYGIVGSIYCVYCKRYLPLGKWTSLLSVYILTFLSVLIEMMEPRVMVEMFCSSISLLMILLLVMRPEERMDASLGTQNWSAFISDLRNITLSGDHVQVIVLQLLGAQETRIYLGERRYDDYLREIAISLQNLYKSKHINVNVEFYVERPGTLYLTVDDPYFDVEKDIPGFLNKIRKQLQPYTDIGIRFDPKVCLIKVPDDISDIDEFTNLCHKFTQFGESDQMIFHVADITRSRNYAIVSHMEEILNRAITENRIVMYYQPIYDMKTGDFQTAEALARLNDSKYGMISPAHFIPVAESTGLIIPFGEKILESVFDFMSRHDLNALGLARIGINLSVMQVLQKDLPYKIARLQKKYNIDPRRVSFEITETIFDNIGDVMEQNVLELKRMGYSFALDDYGIGYSNIQRMSKLPLDIIKIDKSLVDEMFTENGEVIIRNTVRMMQGIHKILVVEGVESKQEIDILDNLSCDYIQGFYFSEPLPESEFIQFMKRVRE